RHRNDCHMKIRDTLLANIQCTPSVAAMIGQIDFGRVNDLVGTKLSEFIRQRGVDVVRRDLMYDLHSPTYDFITHLMEVESVQLLKENGLLYHERFIDALYVLISSISIGVAGYFRQHQIASIDSCRYFNASTYYLQLEQAVENVYEAWRCEGYRLSPSDFQLQHL
ncbi:MAG TPA: hypothetical protein VFL47_10020, partial [Flavisolibacter sp.]|nr:hypothetical protein [Flavisolibacter sp.]